MELPKRFIAFLHELANTNAQYGCGTPMQEDVRAVLAAIQSAQSRIKDLEAEVSRFKEHAHNERAARKSIEHSDLVMHRQLAESLRDEKPR